MASRYPQSKLILLDARAVWLTVVFTIAALLLLAVDVFFFKSLRLSLIASGLAFLAALLHLCLGFAHRCPACGNHPTLQGFAKLHPSVADHGDQAWVVVVKEVLKVRSFTCFRCGAPYTVSGAA